MKNQEPKEFLGAHIPASLKKFIRESGAKENRSQTKQTIQLLNEARAARIAKDVMSESAR